ncbi:hypothetical protein MKW92_013511 [Papaver armeniacum]|nr:hypothetical protein MKW92_013511 [Papaver armeniacum]
MEKQKVEGIEETFVLAYPDYFRASCIGALVSFFEEKKFHLKGMMLMHVSEKFIEKHLQNVGEEHGGEPDDELSCFNWVHYLTAGPVVAMILEGHEAANKIKLLASNRETVFFWSFGRPAAYCSGSADRANQDIQTWFGQDSKAERSNLVHLHAGGGTRGPLDRIYKTLENDSYYRMFVDKPMDLHACFLKEPMSFLVIKPKAFDKDCVGEILSAVEHNSYIVRGLKLVKKSEHPDSIVWSDSSASTKTDGDDEYGIAMVVTFLSSNFELRDKAPDLKYIDLSSEVYLVGSNYVYQSKPDEMRSDVDLFFPHGLTIWTDPESQYLFGKMFEPTLIGLDWED